MDEYQIDAYPNFSPIDFDTKNISSCSNDKYFNVEFECTNMYVLSARKFQTINDTKCHKFSNVSKDKIMQETTIVSWLSQMDVPQDAFGIVVAKILECARDMVRAHKNVRVIPIRVNIVVTRASEDESDEDGEDGSDERSESDEAEEGLEVEEEKNCSICFENFNFNVGVPMPCLHLFHIKCIRGWLEKGNSCPLCRHQLPSE
ncbi:unnamed protein product [Trifolium pratense]|uniref:Uncharacterized protein n=1 Tax=Trifolium pratense TaxID=57577 RepID=A0ACB0LW39_TRIPR|nr:unnamed protein product [Trifolium pratense]